MLIDVSKHTHFVRSVWIIVWLCPRISYQTCLSEPRFLSKNPPKTLLYEVWSNNGTHWFITWWNQECPVLPNRRLHRALMKCFTRIKGNRCSQPHEKQSSDLLWVPRGQSFFWIREVAPAESEYSSGATTSPQARLPDSDLGGHRLHSTMFHLITVLAKYLWTLQTVGNLTASWGALLYGPSETVHNLVLP